MSDGPVSSAEGVVRGSPSTGHMCPTALDCHAPQATRQTKPPVLLCQHVLADLVNVTSC